MTFDVRFRPLVSWPRKQTPAHQRKSRAFKAGYNDTLNFIERELAHLKATDIVIEIGCREQDLRNDGWPRTDARITFPGVIVSATTKYGPLRWPCDACTTFEHNLRAIAMTLSKLREANTYGVTAMGEQYTGWRPLPPGEGAEQTQAQRQTPDVSPATAAEFLLGLAGLQMKTGTALQLFSGSAEKYDEIWRKAAKKHHPDVGGDPEKWALFDKCKRVMDRYMETRKAGAA